MSLKILTRDVPPRSALALEQAGIHPLLSRLFAARGILSAEELDDGLAKLLAPNSLKGNQAAAVLIPIGIVGYSNWPNSQTNDVYLTESFAVGIW